MTEYKRWLPIILFSVFLFILYNLNRFYKTENFDYSPFSLSGSGIQIKFHQDECLDDLSWISADNNYTCAQITEEGPGCYFSDVNGFTGFNKCPRSCGNCQDQLFPGDSPNNTMLSAPDALYDNESGEMLGQVTQGAMNIGNSTMATFSDKRLYEIEEEFEERLSSMEENISELLQSVYDDVLLGVAEQSGDDVICLRNQREDPNEDASVSFPTDCTEDNIEPEYGPRLCPNVSDKCYSCLPPSILPDMINADLNCPDGDDVIRTNCDVADAKANFKIIATDPVISLTTEIETDQSQIDNMCSLHTCLKKSNTDKFDLYKWFPVNNTDDEDGAIPNLGMMLDINIKNVNCYDLKNLSNYVGDTLNEDLCSKVIYTKSINREDGTVNWKPLYERCPIRCNDTCKELLVSDEETRLEEYNPLADYIDFVDTSRADITSDTVEQIHLGKFVERNPDSEDTDYIYPENPDDSDSVNNSLYLTDISNEDRDLVKRLKYLLTLIK